MDAKELNMRLAQQAEKVCQKLFPNGKVNGGEFLIGSLSGEEGESLRINIRGSKAGNWCDFSDREHRATGLLSLWIRAKGIPAGQAIGECMEFMGIRDDRKSICSSEVYKAPDKSKCAAIKDESAVVNYLTCERLIPKETVDKYMVCQSKKSVFFPTKGGKLSLSDIVVFPTIEDGKAVMIQYLAVSRPEGKKLISREPGGKPCLWGKQTVPEDAESIVITEGQIDAMTWSSRGYHAVSVPSGVSDDKWITLDYDFLSRFENIYLSFDMDEVGKRYVENVVYRLGKERCLIVDLPEKDANKCLTEKCFEPEEALENARMVQPSEFKEIDDYIESSWLELHPEEESDKGYETPWNIPWLVRSSQVTVLTGYEGSGKSRGWEHLVVHLASEYALKSFVASFEIPVEQTIADMVQISSGSTNCTKEKHIEYCMRLKRYVIPYDFVGRKSWEEIIEDMNYAYKRYGAFLYVIDSLMRCGIPHDDFKAQNDFLLELSIFAKRTKSHVILVAHARKGKDGQDKVPETDDIAGHSGIKDNADNVVCWWRNKNKENLLYLARKAGDTVKEGKIVTKEDGKICLKKNRKGGKLGMVDIHFDYISGQFTENKGKVFDYFNDPF